MKMIDDSHFVHNHYINITLPARVIVENIIPRNVIINRGAAEVDNHISRDDISTITLAGNVLFILLYRTEHKIPYFLKYFSFSIYLSW